MPSRLTRTFFLIGELLVVACSLAIAVVASRPSEWQPVSLVGLLTLVCVGGNWIRLTVRGQTITGGFVAFVLSIALLGPAPSVAMGGLSAIAWSWKRHYSPATWISHFTSRTVPAILGAGVMLLATGQAHNAGQSGIGLPQFALSVFVLYLVANAANFAIVALDARALEGDRLRAQIREAFVPMLPGQIVAAALTAVLAVAYVNFTLWAACATVIVLAIVQSLMTALTRSEERADQLEARSIHLASLQFGVLATLVETLALRDRSTARHSAAVARYARELAKAAGCDESVQELAHTAGLLHDIGKFALPDRVLHADILSDADWALIRRHPQEGATLVGRLDGYGSVAEAILYHHERIDGDGYPVGLIGTEIPLVSRMIAIASTFDTLTARDTYRTPMSPQDAIAELRRVAGRQLDAELVEVFVAMVERDGRIEELYAGEASFEDELEFGRRVREIATSAT